MRDRRIYGFGDADLIRPMADTIVHRGPDGDGFFVGDGVALGNRRLAIQDVAGGSQPMTNEDGTVFVVVCNGETYNYPQLRRLVVRRPDHRGRRRFARCQL